MYKGLCIGMSEGINHSKVIRILKRFHMILFFSRFISWALFCFEQGGGRAWVHKLLTVLL